MTTDGFNKKLDSKLAALIKEDKPLLLGVKSIMSIQAKRIWLDGKNKNGGNIGEYTNRKDIYLNPKSLVKGATRSLPGFPLKGKTGETTFKNGKKHKTGYFETWPVFKKEIGRNKRVKSVDLFLTGTLLSDWANAELPKDAKAIKVDAHNYYLSLSKLSVDKADKYNGEDNKVFGLSTKEKEQFLAVVRHELKKALE